MNNNRRDEIQSLFLVLGTVAGGIKSLTECVEAIREDENETLENMPDGLKESERGEIAQSAVERLDEAIDQLGSIDLASVQAALEEASDRSGADTLPDAKLDAKALAQRRYDRLPPWARETIERLEAELAKVKAEAGAEFKDWEEGSVRPVFKAYNKPFDGKEIPCDRIAFPALAMEIQIERGTLQIRSERPIIIHPEVTNVIRIAREEY